MSFEVSYKFPTSGVFKPFKGILDKNIASALKVIQKRLTMEVKQVHRYKFKTRTLRNATRTRYKRGRVQAIAVWVDEGKASYAKFIIGGTRKWKADRYVNRALQKNMGWIISQLEAAVERSVDEFNKG